MLWDLILTRGRALEADFQRFYQLDLGGLWSGSLSLRKAAVLAEYLPGDAAIYRTGPDDRFWSTESQLLAHILDVELLHTWVAAGQPGQRPKAVPRPGDGIREEQKAAAIAVKLRKREARRARRRAAANR